MVVFSTVMRCLASKKTRRLWWKIGRGRLVWARQRAVLLIVVLGMWFKTLSGRLGMLTVGTEASMFDRRELVTAVWILGDAMSRV